ncbi:MAG: hypothetical protein MRY83_17630 [Flavobacteriales bacterium]|nr:hypothetical protein [Flavobacteriales bacterium]
MIFLTIEEAIAQTGKSESTIRRLIRSLSNTDEKKFLKKERLANGGYKYRISKEFLQEKYGKLNAAKETPKKEKPVKKRSNDPAPNTDITNLDIALQYIESLERQIRVKDTQLLERDKQISELIDRDRESNILLDKINDALIKYRIPEMLEAQTVSFDEAPEDIDEPESKNKKKKKKAKKSEKKKDQKDLVSNHKPLAEDDTAPFSEWLNHLS